MNTKKKTVFLPIETMAREYQYKLVLASKLAAKGFRVVLGHASYIDKIKNNFPAGAYIGKNLFKTLFPTNLSVYHSYKKRGWSLLHLDEEGAIFAGRENEWEQELNGRLDPNVLGDDDKILTWGTFQSEHYQCRLNNERKVKIIPTGQPKFFYKEPLYSKILKIDFDNKFILFNMNYSVFNNQLGMVSFLNSKDIYRYDYDDNYQYKRSVWLDQINNVGVILSVINRMLKDPSFSSFKFVIRPHPAENDSLYKSFFYNNERIIITNTFTAVEWSKKAYCTIHDGCTTGVEAYLAGCKVINYREQFKDEMVINIIPNSVGLKASNYDELKDRIFGDFVHEKNENELMCSKMILNFNSDVDSYQNVIDETLLTLESKKASSVSNWIFLFDYIEFLKFKVKYVLRVFFSYKRDFYFRDKKKFDGFDAEDVSDKMKIMNEGEGYKVKVSRYHDKYIIIE